MGYKSLNGGTQFNFMNLKSHLSCVVLCLFPSFYGSLCV